MNYEHLKYILKVKELGSITEASEYSFISQPHLSTIIQSMERELGFKIFHRSRSGVEATAESRDFFKQAEEVLKHIDEFQEYFKYTTEEIYRLKIATVPYCYAEETVGRMLHLNKAPNIDVYIENLHSFIMPKRVMDGYFEVGLMSYNMFFKKYIEDLIQLNQMEYVEVARFVPKLLISKRHPNFEELSQDFSKLQYHTMVRNIMLEDDVVPTYDIFKNTNIKLPQKNYITTNDVFTINHYISKGEAYTICLHEQVYPEWLAFNGIEQIPLPELGESISLGYIYSTVQEMSPYLASLVTCWKDILKEKNIIE